MSLYRVIFKQAWLITRKFKYLWFFGLFALLAFLGQEGEMNILFKMFSFDPNSAAFPGLQSIIHSGLFSQQGLLNASRFMTDDPFEVIGIIFSWLLIISLVVFVVWLTNVCLVALVNNSALIIGRKKTGFEEGIQTGMKKFWPVFSFNLLLKVIVFIFFLPFVVIALSKETYSLNLIYVMLFILFIPLTMSAAFIFRYAIAYSVIKGKKFSEALSSGWKLFATNWLVSLEFAFLLFLINALLLFSVFIVFLFMFTPVYFMLIVAQRMFSLVGFWIIVVGVFVAALFALALVGSAFAVFQTASWTNLFVVLEGRGGTSKIVRFFTRN